MKQFVLLLLSLITVSCAVTPQQKAEKAVKEYMRDALDNPKAYEPVSFSPVDTIYTTYDSITDSLYTVYRKAKRSYRLDKSFYDDADLFMKEYYKEEMQKSKKTIDELQPYADSIESHFIPKPRHLSIHHTYRAENKFGAIVKESHFYTISFDYSRVRIEF